MSPELSAYARRRIAELEAEEPRLVQALKDSQQTYADEKPRFDLYRQTYPSVQHEEAQAIQGIGMLQDSLQLARAELQDLKGEGPRFRQYIELDGSHVGSLRTAIADRSRADAGRLDQD